MKKILLPSLALVIGLGVGAVLAGQVHPDKERVREALYTACVNGAHHASEKAGDGLACNRQSINLALAIIYGDSYMPPIEPARYEAELAKYKGR